MSFPNIKAEMARHGEKQVDIATLLGISDVCFNRRLRGVTNFTIEELSILREHWNVSIDYLVDEVPSNEEREVTF